MTELYYFSLDQWEIKIQLLKFWLTLERISGVLTNTPFKILTKLQLDMISDSEVFQNKISKQKSSFHDLKKYQIPNTDQTSALITSFNSFHFSLNVSNFAALWQCGTDQGQKCWHHWSASPSLMTLLQLAATVEGGNCNLKVGWSVKQGYIVQLLADLWNKDI